MRLAVCWLALSLLPATAFSARFIFTAEELRSDLATRLNVEEMTHVEVPFEIDEPIRAWSRSVTREARNDPERAEMLARAILHADRLRSTYDESTTITAREVFESGRGNCISLTNLFVGIARDMGMVAFYVDVNEAIKVRKIQDLIVARGHVCAGVRFPYKFVLYDFAEQPERTYRHYTILDDREAVATFLLARTLNKTLHAEGSEEIEALLAIAREDTRLALKVKPDFAKAYVNLGTALLRLDREEAIGLYRKAVDLSPQMLAAHLALGYVYAQDGKTSEARQEYEKAADALPEDPLVLYHLGVAQYRDRDFAAARRTLEHAVQLDPKESEAWAGLGLTYRALKDEPAALRAFLTASQGGESRGEGGDAKPSDPAVPSPLP